jgi:diadenosine tetraphosphatase ApaH/serine/threonine PP2A family protein phosphatase
MPRSSSRVDAARRADRSRTTAIDQRHLTGPFDIIGDVHGCAPELDSLFARLGYERDAEAGWRAPSGRLPVFIGDLVDRGPASVAVVDLVMRMVTHDAALCVAGNHDLKVARYLAGEPLPLLFGLDTTIAEFEQQPSEVRERALTFLGNLPGQLVFDAGRLVVAHTGLPEALHGVDTPEVRHLAAYGEHDDAVDPRDIEGRHPWLVGYSGSAYVVYGHTPVLEPVWRGLTIDIDTGCVFGWRLTSLRWPERVLVSVPAERVYASRRRPFLPEAGTVSTT